MCVTHVVRFCACPHIETYCTDVHEPAIYCSQQILVDDGIHTSQKICGKCAIDQTLEHGWVMLGKVQKGGDDTQKETNVINVDESGWEIV